MEPGTPSFETRPAGTPQDEVREKKPKQQFRREKRDVHGWLVLDKAVGMTSTQAVGAIKRLFSCKRAGHAGTLDPLASGCLPIALGEATKTVPFVMDGRKTYSFTVRWGEELIGMTTAWLHAGSRCVVASAAAVSDEVAHDVLVRVHRGLGDGEEPATALAHALPSVGADGPPAPFVCFG